MMPNSAVGLLLLGVAGALRWREGAGRVARTLSLLAALVVLAIGLGTLAEYALQVDLSIDQLFVPTQGGPHPGRASPPTQLALTLLAAALLLFDTRRTARVRPSEWLVLLAGATALAGISGLILGAGPFYQLGWTRVVGMALPTSIGLLAISLGLLLERPRAGVMRVATSPGPGGILLRRLVPPAVLAPVLLGLAHTQLAEILGIEDSALVIALLTTTMTVVSVILLLVTAVPLNRSHAALAASREWTRSLLDKAPDGIFVADLDGRYTDVNDAGCRMLGHSREEIIGKTILDLIPPEDAERLWRTKQQLLGGAVAVGEWTLRRKDGSYLPVEVSASILPGRPVAGLRPRHQRAQAPGQGARRLRGQVPGHPRHLRRCHHLRRRGAADHAVQRGGRARLWLLERGNTGSSGPDARARAAP